MLSTARSQPCGRVRSGSRRTSGGVFVRLRSTACVCVCVFVCFFGCSLSQHDALGRLLGHLRQRLAVGIGLFGEPARVPAHERAHVCRTPAHQRARAHFHAQHSGSAADFCCGLLPAHHGVGSARSVSRLWRHTRCGTQRGRRRGSRPPTRSLHATGLPPNAAALSPSAAARSLARLCRGTVPSLRNRPGAVVVAHVTASAAVCFAVTAAAVRALQGGRHPFRVPPVCTP